MNNELKRLPLFMTRDVIVTSIVFTKTLSKYRRQQQTDQSLTTLRTTLFTFTPSLCIQMLGNVVLKLSVFQKKVLFVMASNLRIVDSSSSLIDASDVLSSAYTSIHGNF